VRFALVLLLACSAASAPRYPLHPRVRSASGGPVMLLGAVAHPGAVPYSLGITLTAALRLAGGPTALANRAVLRREGQTYVMPLFDLVNHETPDPELAPGDLVTLDEVSD